MQGVLLEGNMPAGGIGGQGESSLLTLVSF
jgi:hypothetical protein